VNEPAERLTRMAELAIRVGVDVRPGQLVVVLAQVEKCAPHTRDRARRVPRRRFVRRVFGRALNWSLG